MREQNIIKFLLICQFSKLEFFEWNKNINALRAGVDIFDGGKGNLNKFLTSFVENCRCRNEESAFANENDCTKNGDNNQGGYNNKGGDQPLIMVIEEVTEKVGAKVAKGVFAKEFDGNLGIGSDDKNSRQKDEKPRPQSSLKNTGC